MQASINGIQLHYEDTGRGPPVVWQHGLMGSVARQRRVNEGIDGLERHGFRLISYDARGHGESGFTENEADYSWFAHAEILSGLLRQLGIERAILGGGSMGAGVSLAFAVEHPERVHKLLLIAPPPMADTFEPAKQIFNGFATLIETQGIEKAVEVAMQLPQFAELKDTQPEEHAEVREWLLSQRSRAVVPAIRGLLNGPPLPEDRFHEIKAPTLIVAHPDDPIHPESSAEKLHTDIAGSRLIVAPEMMYFQEHHDELLEVIAEFLQGEG